MKKASRFMPKYIPKKASPVELAILFCVFILVSIFFPVFLIIFVVLCVFIGGWSYFEKPKIDNYFESLYNERKDLSICDFTCEFNPKEVDTWIIRATYEQLQKSLGTKKLIPIKSSDHLFDDLMLDEDDLDLDLAEEIAQRTGRSLDNIEKNPHYGKVQTAKDLVLFFNKQILESAT